MQSAERIVKIDAAKRALLQVLSQLPDDAQVGVLALNSRDPRSGPWIVPLGTLDRAPMRRAIQRIGADGGTPLGAAMKQASDALLAAREKHVYGDYRLLIVTDGEAQDRELVDAYLPDILARQITVDVIGVSMDRQHSLAQRVDRYRSAGDLEALQAAIEESLAESPLDPQDADEAADFALLASWPEPLISAAIEGLTKTNNRPIGQDDSLEDQAEEADELATNRSPQVVPGAPAPAASRPSRLRPVIVLMGVILVIAVVLKSMMRSGPRRR
jgi:hypothetical protein